MICILSIAFLFIIDFVNTFRMSIGVGVHLKDRLISCPFKMQNTHDLSRIDRRALFLSKKRKILLQRGAVFLSVILCCFASMASILFSVYFLFQKVNDVERYTAVII